MRTVLRRLGLRSHFGEDGSGYAQASEPQMHRRRMHTLGSLPYAVLVPDQRSKVTVPCRS